MTMRSACPTYAWRELAALAGARKAAFCAARQVSRRYTNRGVSDPASASELGPGAVRGSLTPWLKTAKIA